MEQYVALVFVAASAIDPTSDWVLQRIGGVRANSLGLVLVLVAVGGRGEAPRHATLAGEGGESARLPGHRPVGVVATRDPRPFSILWIRTGPPPVHARTEKGERSSRHGHLSCPLRPDPRTPEP